MIHQDQLQDRNFLLCKVVLATQERRPFNRSQYWICLHSQLFTITLLTNWSINYIEGLVLVTTIVKNYVHTVRLCRFQEWSLWQQMVVFTPNVCIFVRYIEFYKHLKYKRKLKC